MDASITLPPSSDFFLTKRSRNNASHPLQFIAPELISINKFTRIKTAPLFTEGYVIVEDYGKRGELHQLSVMSAGCSTMLNIYDGKRIMLSFPALQTGSFKLEAAFNDGLFFEIYSSKDAPPHMTLNWRVI